VRALQQRTQEHANIEMLKKRIPIIHVMKYKKMYQNKHKIKV